MPALPGYTLTTNAYEGSETTLYRGRRDADGAPVAVKLTRSQFPTAKELLRLRREFAILNDLRDVPGVVRAYALEKHGRSLALVMEDLGPSSLRDVEAARRVDVGAALCIAVSLAGTLAALHERGVIHKDIKPHNIMIDEAMSSPRLVDFGISARLEREAAEASSPAALEGTLAYMSPEQTGRMNRAVDRRTDLYSLGVTLYELLTGALPFPWTDADELTHSHIARSPTPPHTRATEVPQAVSDVVMKLLAKMPEERYQSARGLKADLERCLAAWSESGRVDRFPLGQEDRTGELRVPQKLHGREREAAVLLAAEGRARRGATEIVFISGDEGVGKSALANELQKPIASHGGAFIRAEFDPSRREIPLAPVAHALRDRVRQILAEPAAALDAWRRALLEAVGTNGKLLFSLIPELELVLGPQPDAPALGGSEAQNRFERLMRRFVRALATPAHPLVFLLEDLQWADPASIRLLVLLRTDLESKHTLLVGTYRESEVDEGHPLRAAQSEIKQAGGATTAIALRPLDPGAVTALLAEALGEREANVAELSALIFEKTLGNPLFLGQFLGALHAAGHLSFDAASGAFTWDRARVREALATENVVDLLVSKLERLDPSSQRALSLAACFGAELDLGALARIHQKTPSETAADLWPALREGLLAPQSGDYRFLDVSAGAAEEVDAGDLEITYRFAHDRVREAAYALVPEARKAEVHLSIGRLLWERSGEPPRDPHVLDIARHLRLGEGAMKDEAERIAAARLHLRAGKKAKAMTAYKAAADALAAGIEILGQEGWARDDALGVSLRLEGAECAHLAGLFERAEALFDELLPRPLSALDRARIHGLRMTVYGMLGRYSDAAKAGIEGLSTLGVALPATPAERQAAFGAGLVEVAEAMEGRSIPDLIDAPKIDDPEKKAALKLLSDFLMVVFLVEPDLYPATVFKLVTLSLRHGHSDVSSLGYAAYSFLLATILGKPSEGIAFGKLALALNDTFPTGAAFVPRLNLTFGSLIHVGEPLRAAMPYYEAARRASLECGDFVSLSGVCYNMVSTKLGAGYPLDEVESEIEGSLGLMRRTRNETVRKIITIQKQMVASLKGRTRGRTSLSDEGFDEESFVAALDENEHAHHLFLYHLTKLTLHGLHGEPEAAAAAAEEAERRLMSAIGMYNTTRLHFHACLSLLALSDTEDTAARERRGAAISHHRSKIAALAAESPQTFKHQLVLIEAEAARRAGKFALAVELYDEAITLAKQNDFPHDEALANELCARMHLAAGRVRSARGYLDDAYLGYLCWGATAKAEDIAREHGKLLPSLASGKARRATASGSVSGVTMTTVLGQALVGDLHSAALVVRAAQAIAGEITLPNVIERLSRIMLESAGAEHGALVLSRGGALSVEATFGVTPEALRVGPTVALESSSDLAQSVALFVARSREPVVLDDARKDARFASDPHLARGDVRSVLCLPLLHQGRLSGLLYLENKKARVSFDATRLELLELFSSQAAIAIENAQLVADVREANEQTRLANERLEAEVRQRTEELRLSNQELSRELAQREQAERERAALQEQMIAAQRERLLEMSTPLIPITDGIMVMPLIGSVDAERAAQVMEVALHGTKERRARVVILDITGIKQIDAHVIQTLLGSAAALRLLGARAVLTGVRPEVAQTMVELGADLQGLVTKGTLQSGIAYALEMCGEAAFGRRR
jgi:predicted ATPase/GAF domain-containing protein/tRNA A-37 threonylcarbamoyl transferase component Bud32